MEQLLITLIIGILILLFILSLAFKASMFGTLAGIGMIIFSFTFITIYFWLFLVLVFAGLTMLAVSIFN